MKKNDSLKSIIVLVSICIVIGAAMAGVNMLTEERIAAVHAEKEAKAIRTVLPENEGFTKIENAGELPDSVVSVFRDNDGEGIAMLLKAKGYDSSNPINIAVGFNSDGSITECCVISCTGETSGIGTKVKGEGFLSSFNGKTDTDGIDAISGATISSTAFLEAVEEAFELLANLNVNAEVDQ